MDVEWVVTMSQDHIPDHEVETFTTEEEAKVAFEVLVEEAHSKLHLSTVKVYLSKIIETVIITQQRAEDTK